MNPDSLKVKGVGAILINQCNEIILQKRTLDAPSAAGKIGIFGGRSESDETLYDTLARELHEELEFDITNYRDKLIYLTHSESLSTPGQYYLYYLLANIDDSALVLHEGESIIKVKKLSDIPEDQKSYGLTLITDKMIQNALST